MSQQDVRNKTSEQLAFTELRIGDPVPYFSARGGGLQKFVFDSIAGRYLLLCFYSSTSESRGREATDAVLNDRDRFDDDKASFFGISLDPTDESEGRVKQSFPGIRFLWDFDANVSRLYGSVSRSSNTAQPGHLRQFWMIVDPTLRVMAKFPFLPDGSDYKRVFDFLDALPHPNLYAGFEMPAPILVIPNVFEPGLCQQLIGLYDRNGGGQSGVMRPDKSGRVTGVLDSNFKRRRDYTVEDPELIRTLQSRIRDRVLPDIQKLFFMHITRMERYIVGCYAAEDGGHFRPHRDNTSSITAHRRYAVSINLNKNFEGGEVSFPEYSRKEHKAPPGWAIIFPCAILHAVSKVSHGSRYAFLPFVYDEGGKKIREHYSSKRVDQTAAVDT